MLLTFEANPVLRAKKNYSCRCWYLITRFSLEKIGYREIVFTEAFLEKSFSFQEIEYDRKQNVKITDDKHNTQNVTLCDIQKRLWLFSFMVGSVYDWRYEYPFNELSTCQHFIRILTFRAIYISFVKKIM